MKIPVRNENQNALGATVVKIKDLSTGLQKITVQAIKKRTRIPVKHAEEERPKAPAPPVQEKITPPPATQTNQPPPAKPRKAKKKFAAPIAGLRKTTAKATKKMRLPGAVAGLLLLAVAGIYFTTGPTDADVSSSSDTSETEPALEYGTPPFTTVLPEGKDIAQLGGWVRVSPPGRQETYAFTDTIDGVGIAVSQQPLPDDFSEDPEENLSQVASDFGTTEKISVDETTVHIGTSTQGPQSVLFTRESLLILIKSANPLETDQWSAYIASLQ